MSKHSDFNTVVEIPLMLITLSGVLFACAGCGQPEDVTVKFIVPDGARGIITLELDARRGVKPKAVNGTVILRIPKSGVLRVSEWEPLDKPHKLAAEFRNGDMIPTETCDNVPVNSETGVILWSVGAETDAKGTRMYHVLGSEKEMRDFENTRAVWFSVDGVQRVSDQSR